ncbi:hypothetical protein BDF14DRAFT_1878038 [Spinellus fusiger]|nr:hypothetical protein BDF14DRAFT_1878038 [Spinellus fusiger]
MFANTLTPAFLLTASTYAVSCGKNHKAWVWNCQTILDNWSLDDNTVYSTTSSNMTRVLYLSLEAPQLVAVDIPENS